MSPDFKPGDPEPREYLDWHAWAEVQHKAGLKPVPRDQTIKIQQSEFERVK